MDESLFKQRVKKAKETIKGISREEVVEKQNSGAEFLFVDVREDNEWAKSRVTGAVHIGKGVLERDIEKHTTQLDQCIVLY